MFCLCICTIQISWPWTKYWPLFGRLPIIALHMPLWSPLVHFFSSPANYLKHFNCTRQDQQEKASVETNENDPSTAANKEDDLFAGLDNVPGN
jgi:hypothetical protein